MTKSSSPPNACRLLPDRGISVSLFLTAVVPGAAGQCRALAARIGEEVKSLGRAVSVPAVGHHPKQGHVRLSIPVVIPQDDIIPGAEDREDAPAGAYWILHGRAYAWEYNIALDSD